jgi:DNA-binding NarL/FixJ family response regulator
MPTNYKVFIVDNDSGALKWLTELFSKYFTVSRYIEGEEFLRAIEDDECDEHQAALIDLRLDRQRFSGAELCREVKKRKPYLPVFAVTGSADSEYIANAILDNGFEGYIPKNGVRKNPDRYISAILEAVSDVQKYPELPVIWHKISAIQPDNFRYLVKKELVEELLYKLRKAYFYLLLPESLPLLDSLLLDEKTSCGESIVQSAAAIETILNYEDRDWREEVVNKGSGAIKRSSILPTPRETKLDRVINADLIPGSSKRAAVKLFGWRDDCAHASKRARRYDKGDTLSAIKITLDIVEFYLARKSA